MDTIKTSVIAALPDSAARQGIAACDTNISTPGKRSEYVREYPKTRANAPIVTSHLDPSPAVSQAEIELVMSFLHDTIAAIMRDN
jgi:hypothetical protein